MGMQDDSFSKIIPSIIITYYSIPHMDIYSKELQAGSSIKIGVLMFRAADFTIAKSGSHLNIY